MIFAARAEIEVYRVPRSLSNLELASSLGRIVVGKLLVNGLTFGLSDSGSGTVTREQQIDLLERFALRNGEGLDRISDLS